MSFPPQSPIGSFPPPHRILYEPLNDRETAVYWEGYKAKYQNECDFEEIDAATKNSMDDFAKWFAQWVTFAPSRQGVRVRILMVWHAHFLSLACQQMLRRSLEQRSFRCRVWFHIEEPTLQSAIISRCIVTTMPSYQHLPKIEGTLDTQLWDNPRALETILDKAKH
jgi:hypothetical protein